MIVGDFGPVFPIRSALLDMGFARTSWEHVPDEAGRFDLNGASEISGVWRDLEPLILALALAGYECRQVVVGQAERGTQVAGYLSFNPLLAGATYVPDHWPAKTGVPLDPSWFTAVLVRATPRRTYGEPSPYPPIPLAGLPGFVAFREPSDAASDPADGWIVIASSGVLEAPKDFLAAGAALPRNAIVNALATAWEAGGNAGGAVGLLRTLDANSWQITHDTALSATRFRQLGADIWRHLTTTPLAMRDFVGLEPGAGAADVKSLASAAGSAISVDAAFAELDARRLVMHPTNASVEVLLGMLRRRHWLITLLALHDYGLVCVLPFPLRYEVGIPYTDLTGWYDTVAGEQPRRCMQLNQAADQLDGWWQDDQLERWSIDAEQGPYATNPGFVGYDVTFTARSDGRSESAKIDGVALIDDPDDDCFVDVTFRGVTHHLVRSDRVARLAPEIRMRRVPEESRPTGEAMSARLHPDADVGMVNAILVLLDEIRRVGDTSQSSWRNEIVRLELNFRTALRDEGVYSYEPSRINETPMLRRLRVEVRIILPRRMSQGVDAWQKLLQILTVVGANDPTAATLRALLGMATGEHQYTFQFVGAGLVGEVEVIAGVSAGAMAIGGPVAHLRECPLHDLDTQPGWTEICFGGIQQAGASLAVGAMLSGTIFDINLTSNELLADNEWHPEHFGRELGELGPARCVFVQGTLSTAYAVAEKVMGEAGYETWEGYTFLTTLGWSFATGSGDGYFVSVGAGFGAEMVTSFDGVLGFLFWHTPWSTNPPTVEVPEAPLVAAAEGIGEAGFLPDLSDLSVDGRKRFAMQIATYRPLFESPGSVLVVEGDASRTAPGPYNDQLSWQRAQSVYSWVRSALTSERTSAPGRPGQTCALAIPEGRVQMFGYGEMEAEYAGIDDEVEGDPWRKAKLTVNNSELLVV